MFETGLICFSTFALSLSCLYFTELSTWIKRKLSKTVVCWFCHVNSRVKYEDSNSWTCSSCGQYNGFTKDGDYNRELPGQFDERLNIGAGTFSRCSPQFKRSNSLCPQCNYNQELKIKQLASFEPISQTSYDKEVLHFKQQLEESYKLCTKCEKLVASVISSQKYVLPGPRRLALIASSITFKPSWSLYVSIILCFLMSANRLLTFATVKTFMSEIKFIEKDVVKIADPLIGQILAGLGVIVHTLQCCQFGTYWSFINWLVWAVMASSPHFLESQRPHHVAFIQVVICFGLLLSTGIILLRRKKMVRSVKIKEEQRQARRQKENATAVWNSVNHSSVHPQKDVKNVSNLRRRAASPVKLVPSSTPRPEMKIEEKKNLIKPVPRIPETTSDKRELDLSSLSISGRTDNPFNKGLSPWDRVTMTRCSSYSSGISSLRTSPCSWKTTKDLRGSPENSWAKTSPPSTSEDWSKNSLKDSTFRHQNDSWSPVSSYNCDWDLKKSSWPAHVYSYPVAYTWPNMVPPWDSMSAAQMSQSTPNSSNQNKTNALLSSLPTVILAATNACLVYYIIQTKT